MNLQILFLHNLKFNKKVKKIYPIRKRKFQNKTLRLYNTLWPVQSESCNRINLMNEMGKIKILLK